MHRLNIGALLVFYFFLACTEVSPNLQYSLQTLVYNEPDCDAEKEACLHVTLHYPFFDSGDSAAVALMNLFVGNHILEVLGMGDVESDAFPNINGAVKDLQKSYLKLKYEYSDYDTSWKATVTTTKVFESDILLVFFLESIVHFGGAHTNTNRRYYNIEKTTGKDLKYEYFIDDLASFQETAEQTFRHQIGIDDTTGLNESVYQFPNNHFQLSANFGFKGDSIVLFYNRYEIASFATGPTEIKIGLRLK